MALGNNPPSAGPFCLSSYYRLGPVEKAILSRACQSPDRWNRIEIYYSGNREMGPSEDLNCHFVIYNGLGGGDGQIQPTEKWQRQWSIVPGRNWYGSSQTIRICVVADSTGYGPTDYQTKRLEKLVEGLCRKFSIQPASVYFPSDWR